MSTSNLPNDAEIEAKVTDYLSALFRRDEEAVTSASAVSAALDIPASNVRLILSNLALRKILKPVVRMICQQCGTTNDEEEASKDESDGSCYVCGQRTSHTPVLLFALADPDFFKKKHENASPKSPGRTPLPQVLRPRKWFGARSLRHTRIA